MFQILKSSKNSKAEEETEAGDIHAIENKEYWLVKHGRFSNLINLQTKARSTLKHTTGYAPMYKHNFREIDKMC